MPALDRSTPFDEWPQLMSAAEVRAVTGLSRNTVYAMFADLPVVRLGSLIRVHKDVLTPRQKPKARNAAA